MTEDMMRREMRMMKDMGVNFIRLGHYQQSEIILDLCDELGILVWEEIPWCRGGLGGDVYKKQARRMLANMIVQHHNHPAVQYVRQECDPCFHERVARHGAPFRRHTYDGDPPV